MLKYVVLFLVLSNFVLESLSLWDQETDCPAICTCSIEHLTETAIYRFMQRNKNKATPGESGSVENNDEAWDPHHILGSSEEDLNTAEILEEHPSAIVRSVICILQTETDPQELLNHLPHNTETLTYLTKFPALISLELVGPNMMNRPLNNTHLICEIDFPLSDLKYLNLERVLIRNSKQQVVNFLKEVDEMDLTFEYVKKLDGNPHSLTMVQKSTNDEEIVPYKVFKEQKETKAIILSLLGLRSYCYCE
ncbi:hypothetical protein NQ318_015819 [Aromia moschata]|uniref:Uncharacterized protein n=1 Tax=Aromia moschata TaxID=1265417 RepID=A0AAV8YMV1_9CUCU|nr:hypothetical protein NQ318_015819 [Aromia moschata]